MSFGLCGFVFRISRGIKAVIGISGFRCYEGFWKVFKVFSLKQCVQNYGVQTAHCFGSRACAGMLGVHT